MATVWELDLDLCFNFLLACGVGLLSQSSSDDEYANLGGGLKQ